MQTFLASTLLLTAFVAAGVAAIVLIRARYREDAADPGQGAWETTLAEYRNLRDKGVLSAEEYRKIKTLVEPRVESGGRWPATGTSGGRAADSRRVG